MEPQVCLAGDGRIQSQASQLAGQREFVVPAGAIVEIESKGGVKERIVIHGFEAQESQIPDEFHTRESDIQGNCEFWSRPCRRGADIKAPLIDTELQVKIVADLEIDSARQGHAK